MIVLQKTTTGGGQLLTKLFQAVELGNNIVDAEGVSTAGELLEQAQAPSSSGASVWSSGVELLEGHEEPPGVSRREGVGVEHGAVGEDDGVGVDEVEVVGEVCVGEGKLATELVRSERGEERSDCGAGVLMVVLGGGIPLDYVYPDAATRGKREDKHGVGEGVGTHAPEGFCGDAGAERVGVRREPCAPGRLDCGGCRELAEHVDID